MQGDSSRSPEEDGTPGFRASPPSPLRPSEVEPPSPDFLLVWGFFLLVLPPIERERGGGGRWVGLLRYGWPSSSFAAGGRRAHKVLVPMGLTGLRPDSEGKESKSFKPKVEKKLKFYAKVRNAVVALGAKRAISKKKRLRSQQKKLKTYDLSALSEFLPDLNAAKQPSRETSLKINCQTRHKLVQREGAQLKAVLNDPLSAIHQHLQRTQPPSASDQDKGSGKTKKAKKKGAKKSPSGPRSMDF